MILRPEAFEDAFNVWIAHLCGRATVEMGLERPIIAIDGIQQRRPRPGNSQCIREKSPGADHEAMIRMSTRCVTATIISSKASSSLAS